MALLSRSLHSLLSGAGRIGSKQGLPIRTHPALLTVRNFTTDTEHDESKVKKLVGNQSVAEEKERLKAEKAQQKLAEKAAREEIKAQLKAEKAEEKRLLKEEKARLKAEQAEKKKEEREARRREREEKREAKEAERQRKKRQVEVPQIAVKVAVARLYKRCLLVARRVPQPSWQSTMISYVRSSFRENTNTPLALKVSQGQAELKDFEELLECAKRDKEAKAEAMRKW